MRATIFALFAVSGFCGLCYEVVWVRLAMAAFGATTPVVSVVVSVFMGGLAVGAWAGGRWVAAAGRRAGVSPLVLYAATEALIAPGAVAVPALFGWGETALLGLGEGGSVGYLAASAGVIAAVVFPWAALMGATIPVMMGFLKGRDRQGFSYLYLANICGAAAGTLGTAFVLIEWFGFRGTLLVAGALNLGAAVAALVLAARVKAAPALAAEAAATEPAPAPTADPGALSALFATGFLSMGLELAWTRAFGGMLGQSVYAFALILAVYLVASAVGAALYRGATWRPAAPGVLFAAGGLSLLPLVTMDPVLGFFRAAGVVGGLVLGLAPLCVALGYLTPRLVDGYSGGDPGRAGRAYAVNVVGCVLGPLVASYGLLAVLGERWTIVALSVGFAGAGWAAVGAAGAVRPVAAIAALAAVVGGGVHVFSEGPPVTPKVIRTDYTATVAATGQGMGRELLVNGTGMTKLTPLTKFMVHLPAAHHPGRPESALIVCFGMGTSYRSSLSWGMRTTAVELTPSVFRVFDFYHADAADVLRDPNGRTVTDDGRRFLKRTREGFDVIVLDPPPPISAPGSGMLYSTEFYREAARRLNPGGVLQQWYPHGEGFVYQPLLRSVRAVFPHTRVFVGMGGMGTHVLASADPLPALTPADFLRRLPPRAAADLGEWPFTPTPEGDAFLLHGLFASGAPAERHLTDADPRELTDDRPLNEYYFLREGFQMVAPPDRPPPK